jgi:hypothetical protein
MSLKEIEAAIKKLNETDQQKLLRNLPKLLKVSLDTFGWLKLAEPSFAFWDNDEDAIHSTA